LTDYRTLWLASQPLPAVPMRVFGDCPARCRAASESGERLESRQIGVLYSLAKSTSKCRTCLVLGRHGDGRLVARAFSHVPNRKPAQPRVPAARNEGPSGRVRAAVRQPA